jgi:hypothetical protein
MEWIDEFIIRMETAVNGVLEIEVGGQKISAQILPEVVVYFKNNRTMFLAVGQSAFKSFLFLLAEKKQEEAFNVLLQNMSADDIIARMNFNADELAKANKLREDFIKSLKNFILKTLTPIAIKVLWGLLV